MNPAARAFLWGVAVGGIGAIVLAVVGVVVGAKLYTRHVEATLDARVQPPPVPESLDADYAWQAASLDGPPVAMEALKNKVVVLTFWKPDCFSCSEQLEFLETLAGRMRDATVEFATVSIGNEDETRDEVQRLNLSLPIYMLSSPRPKVFETATLPTTFVLNAQGKIAFRFGGIARWDDPAVEAYLRALAVPPTSVE